MSAYPPGIRSDKDQATRTSLLQHLKECSLCCTTSDASGFVARTGLCDKAQAIVGESYVVPKCNGLILGKYVDGVYSERVRRDHGSGSVPVTVSLVIKDAKFAENYCIDCAAVYASLVMADGTKFEAKPYAK